MISERYISIQEAKYLLAKHIPMVMGALMLERFEMRPMPSFGMAEAMVDYYSILTHKIYGFSRPVHYEMIKDRPDMVKDYLDYMFHQILHDVCDEEMTDQEEILLKRVKDEIAIELEERDKGGRWPIIPESN